jgi:hypothetical protein
VAGFAGHDLRMTETTNKQADMTTPDHRADLIRSYELGAGIAAGVRAEQLAISQFDRFDASLAAPALDAARAMLNLE